MSDMSWLDLYRAFGDRTFDAQLCYDTTSMSIVLREAFYAAKEIGTLLYVYKQDSQYRITESSDQWKEFGVLRVYPGGRIEMRK